MAFLEKMIKQKEKKCKGTGQAINWGCGKKSIKRTYGLCNSCYYDWLINSEPGKAKLHKATLKAKSIVRQKEIKELNKAKEKLKTHSEWLQDLQKVFNQYIRKRDAGDGCISCGTKSGQMQAGHYRSVGAAPELRFEELNVHAQCATCNNYLSGNLIEYRINLVKKIGAEKVEWLEGHHEPQKLTIQEIKEKIKEYKDKLKSL